MYITFQPCHLSAKKTPKKSCCDVLLELLKDPRLKDVEMCIKPTHIYKAGFDGLRIVENGKEGIRKLMVAGIKVTRMKEVDWNYLFHLVDMTDTKRRQILSGYSGSEREALDEEIDEFLRFQLAMECPSTHNRLSIKHGLVKQDDVQHLFDNLFQLCAFFHVFEQGAGNVSLCLNKTQCPCYINEQKKPNVIVLKGTYQNDGKMCRVSKECKGCKACKAYEAKYTDCHRYGIKAEQFLNYDAPGLSDNQRDRGIMNGITIYTTWLPRGFSKFVLPLTRCTLVDVCIKPSHLHGGDTSPEDVHEEVVALKRNKYITVKSMTEEDWKYLTANLPEANRNSVPEYDNSLRQHLDEEIERILNPKPPVLGDSGSGGSNSQGPSGGHCKNKSKNDKRQTSCKGHYTGLHF